MKTITGNTYPVKEQLKAMGGRWNSAAQGWDLPDDKAEAAQALVAAAGPSTYTPRPRRSARYGSNYTRFSSGAEMFTNKRGRCEDAPCCGCCS
jgi:hypothetical protein